MSENSKKWDEYIKKVTTEHAIIMRNILYGEGNWKDEDFKYVPHEKQIEVLRKGNWVMLKWQKIKSWFR